MSTASTLAIPDARSDPAGPSARASRTFLLDVARGVRRWLAIAMLGGVVRQAGFLLAPVLLSRAIDDGVLAHDVGRTVMWSLLVVLAAVVQFLGLCVWEQFANRADAEAGASLRLRLREAVIAGDHARRPAVGDEQQRSLGTGDLLVRAGRDVDLIRVWVHGIPTWSVIGVTVAVLLPGVTALDPWLLLVVLATVPVLVVLSIIYPRRFEESAAHAAQAHGTRADAVEHLVRSGATVRGIGVQDTAVRRHHGLSAELARRTVRSSGVLAWWSALGEGVPRIATAVGVLVGGWAALAGKLSPGDIVTFSGWMATVGVAVQVGLMRYTQSVEAKVGAARLVPVLDGAEAETSRSAAVRCTAGMPLRLDGVVVIPGARALDVELRPGHLVALTGPVASGKSTLLRVLAGEIAPMAGSVLVGDREMTERPAWAQRVAQRPLVASGTVRENLVLGHATNDPDADDALFREVLTDVGLADELSGRGSDVLDLQLGDGGGELSGGQRQRLALARALVARPALLLVDDVTSAVDPATARRLVATLRRASRRSLVVASGHDAVLLEEADTLLILDPPAKNAHICEGTAHLLEDHDEEARR